MIWIVLALCVLCIAMSCAALWYREKWRFEYELREALRIEWEITDKRRMDLENWVEDLRSQLPNRDSKGRYCKRKEKR